MRGALDGGADGGDAGRDLRLAAFHEPPEQFRLVPTGWRPISIPTSSLPSPRRPTSRLLTALRSRLRAQVKASPLCDAPRFGRNLGISLRAAWHDWCRQGR